MNTNTHALAAATLPLLSAAVNAIPHTYLIRGTREKIDDVEDQKSAEPQSGNLQLIFLNSDENDQSRKVAFGSTNQCINTGSMAYFTDKSIQNTDKSLSLENCDPMNADEDLNSSQSPNSIVIGCTSTKPKESLISDNDEVIQLVFQKRDSMEGEQGQLQRRWETRKDIELYSDDYHSCRSADSSDDSDCVPQDAIADSDICNDLDDTDVKGDQLPLQDKYFTPDYAVNQPDEEKAHFQRRSKINKKRLDTSIDPELFGQLDHHKLDKARIMYRLEGKGNHAEFMKRWLKGDERPRSFMTENEGERMEKRCNKHHDEDDYADEWDDWKRRSDDEKSHDSHDELERRCNKHKDINEDHDDYFDDWDEWQRRSHDGSGDAQDENVEKRCNKHHDGDCNDDCDQWEKRGHDDSDSDDNDDERPKSRRSDSSDSDAGSVKSKSKRSHKHRGANGKRGDRIYNDAAVSKIQGHANKDYLGNPAFQKRSEKDRRILARAKKWHKARLGENESALNVKTSEGSRTLLRRSISVDEEKGMHLETKRDVANDVWKYTVMPLLLRRRGLPPHPTEVANGIV